MKWVLGIDGGGSKTEAYAVDLKGKVLGTKVGESSNYHTIGLEQFIKNIRQLILQITSTTNLRKENLIIMSLGLAGIGNIKDQELILSKLEELNLPCQFLINNDAKISLFSGTGDLNGITVISGTGSIAFGINEEGREVRAGGWGHILGDEGSGYDIGRKGILAAIKDWENRGDKTLLTKIFQEDLGITDFRELVPLIYKDSNDKKVIASLSQVVVKAAEMRDGVANKILTDAGKELSNLVFSVIQRGFDGKYCGKIVINGSILLNVNIVSKSFINNIKEKYEGVQIVLPQFSPALGAALLALNKVNRF